MLKPIMQLRPLELLKVLRAKREEEERKKQQEILDTVAKGYEETQSGLRYKFYKMVMEIKLLKELMFLCIIKGNY